MQTAQTNVDTLIDQALESSKIDSINEMLDSYELNWEVQKVALKDEGMKTPFYAIKREIEGKDHYFWSCRADYEIFQNSQLAELLFRISEKTGYELEGGGLFDKGANVYLQLKTGSIDQIGKNNDQVIKYLTAINSHDGQKILRWGHTNIVISCRNTFNAAYSQLGNKAKHTSNMKARIEESLKKIESLQEFEKEIEQKYRVMAEKPFEKEILLKVVKSLTKVDMALTKEQIEREYHSYNVKRMNELLDCISRETEEKGKTLWGLFNGVTYYTSHVMPSTSLKSKYIGKGVQLDNAAFSILSEL